MSQTTPRLALPLIAAGQAQKHVTHNEALTALDTLVQLACLDKDRAAPPADPAEGDTYLIAGAEPTGAWAGLSGQVVRFQDGAWIGFAPRPGWLAFVVDEGDLYSFTGSAWIGFRATLTTLQNLARLGIGTEADATNRLAVKSEGVLCSWDDVTPGAGNLRVTLNKGAAANDAGLIVQTGFSTRALLGTLGSDDLTLKVSPDGTSFVTALTASAATGRLTASRFDGPLEISNNAGALPPTPADTVLRVSGADGAQARLVFDAFGPFGVGNFIFRAASGTAAAPTSLAAGAVIGAFTAFGYGATGYSSGGRSQVQFATAETWTDTAQGTRVVFRTTPTGTTAVAEVGAFEANGALLLSPKNGDPTSGAALGQIYASSTETALKWHDGAAWTRVTNFAKFAAHTNFDNYVAADTWTKVQFNAADANDQGAFVPASNRFVAPEAGLYAFSTALAYKRNGTSTPTALQVRFHRNGAAAGRGRAAVTGALVDAVSTVGLTTTLKLAAGDTVEVYAHLTGADGYVAAADSAFGGAQLA